MASVSALRLAGSFKVQVSTLPLDSGARVMSSAVVMGINARVAWRCP